MATRIDVSDLDIFYGSFRAVHDVIGHVLGGHSMGARGELAAARAHLALLPCSAWDAMFVEQVCQTCWFFYGAHLRRPSGELPRPGSPGWVPLSRRPYAEQRVFRPPAALVERFTAGIRAGGGAR